MTSCFSCDCSCILHYHSLGEVHGVLLLQICFWLTRGGSRWLSKCVECCCFTHGEGSGGCWFWCGGCHGEVHCGRCREAWWRGGVLPQVRRDEGVVAAFLGAWTMIPWWNARRRRCCSVRLLQVGVWRWWLDAWRWLRFSYNRSKNVPLWLRFLCNWDQKAHLNMSWV